MNFAEELKSQIDIVRTIGAYVRLRKVGTRFSGLCPFHAEKTPSFSVNPSIGIFICFGCGMKGDVLKFVQEIEHLTFPETLQLLAERNGITMPSRREANSNADLRSALLEIHRVAAEHFHANLFGSGADEVRHYLAQRGISHSLVESFGVGFSDRSGQDLLRKLRQSFGPKEIEASGLVIKRDDGSMYDRFRGRLIFPIHNETGKTIAFGGRTLRADEQPKYLNSPESLIYKKSDTLYNLHRAKEPVRKQDQIVLVEGYMDVIGVYSAGVQHVVASCGTALTESQVRSMRRHSQNVVVNFDPDAAGANATERSLQMLLEEGMHVKVLELEGGLDPDEYVRKQGADSYLGQIARASRYFIWLANRARKTYDSASAEERNNGFQQILLPAIRRISDRIERAAVASEVAEYLGVDRSVIVEEMRRMPKPRSADPPKALNAPVIERVLIRSLLSSDEAQEILLPSLGSFESLQRYHCFPILKVIMDLCEEGTPLSFEAVHERLDEGMQHLLSSALFADSSDEVFSREQALSYENLLRIKDQRFHVEALRTKLKQAERDGNSAEAFRIIEDINRLQTRRKP